VSFSCPPYVRAVCFIVVHLVSATSPSIIAVLSLFCLAGADFPLVLP
jgi:hypothetical protein